MRFTISAILAGILIGAAFYFAPFAFPFFFLILLIFIFSRFFFGWRRWHGGYGHGYRCGRKYGDHPRYPFGDDRDPDITPIDGTAGYSAGTSSVVKRINIQ